MSARPAFVRPLVPGTAKAPPKGGDWIHEVKLDGYRVQVTKDGDRVRVFTRSGAEYTSRLPRMVEAFARLPASSAVLDGELCYVGADGQAQFYALMREMRTRAPDEPALVFFAFDMLHENGVDLRTLPLIDRRRAVGGDGEEQGRRRTWRRSTRK